jgi:hypothetical protein
MSPAQVVLSGGAGLSAATQSACDNVLAQFDPPIIVGTYDSVSKARQKANSTDPNSPHKSGQSEHGVANSAFQSDRGNNASNIPGASGYSEGGAFAFSVFDGQSAGTEHKWLTDAAKDFHERMAAKGKNATLSEHLDESQKNWEKSLDENLTRKKGEKPRSRIKDAEKKSKQERKDLAKAAAKCLRMMAEAEFKKQKISLTAKLRNGLATAVKEAAKAVRKRGGIP